MGWKKSVERRNGGILRDARWHISALARIESYSQYKVALRL